MTTTTITTPMTTLINVIAAPKASPKTPKTFFPKIRMPQKGTSERSYRRKTRRGIPQNPENLFSENKNVPKRDIRTQLPRRGIPQNPENLFSENKNAPKRDIPRPICAHVAPMVTNLQNWVLNLRDHLCSRENATEKVPQIT
jgi:hypothetical protein